MDGCPGNFGQGRPLSKHTRLSTGQHPLTQSDFAPARWGRSLAPSSWKPTSWPCGKHLLRTQTGSPSVVSSWPEPSCSARASSSRCVVSLRCRTANCLRLTTIAAPCERSSSPGTSLARYTPPACSLTSGKAIASESWTRCRHGRRSLTPPATCLLCCAGRGRGGRSRLT